MFLPVPVRTYPDRLFLFGFKVLTKTGYDRKIVGNETLIVVFG